MNLYRQEILEHMRSPRNFGKISKPDFVGKAENRLCGDRIELELKLDKRGAVQEVGFSGSGCAITIASTSMFTEAMKGKRLAEIARLKVEEALAMMGLEVTPARVGCATVALQAARAAFKNHHEAKE
jgi:nitrogen fixation NifU-like protein